MKIKFKKPLPIAGLITATVLAVLLILFVGAYSKRGAFSSINFFEGKEAIIQSQNIDTDGDGLRDWEEELLGTDPNNPDTDGDGFLDGEEINSGHNPLVKAPGDSQVFYPMPLGEKYNITNKLLNDENVKILLDSYTSQKEEYIGDHPQIKTQEDFIELVNPSTVQQMWRRALGDVFLALEDKALEEIEKMPEIFNIKATDKDIKISDDNSNEAIAVFLNQISLILDAGNLFLQETITDALGTAMKENDFSKLDALIKKSDAKIEQAKNIVVPSSWKEIFKEKLELTIMIRNVCLSFRDVLNDPFKAYIAITKLDKIGEDWERLNNQIDELTGIQNLVISD